MKGARYTAFALACGTFLLSACRKNDPQEEAPPISSYRTYELVCAAVKADPWGGQILLCKSSPVDRRTSFLQLMNAEGDLGTRIDLNALPRTAENITFQQNELLYTDFAPQSDGSILVVGIGRQVELEDRLHVIVHHIARDGSSIGVPYRRYLISGGVVQVNIDGAARDLDGLPRIRALCEPMNGSLVVAARWETSSAAGVRLFRFGTNGNTDVNTQTDIALNSADDRLHALSCDPGNDHAVLLVDQSQPGTSHTLGAIGFSAATGGWIAAGSNTLQADNQPIMNAEPQQLQWLGDAFLLVGHRPDPSDANTIKPLVARFANANEVNNGPRVLTGLSSADRPVASYCAGLHNGSLELVTQVHESSALQPFFEGDITSDLEVVGLGYPGLEPGTTTTVIPGQGLRAIGIFSEGGERVLIGSQHPYLNAGFVHTFRVVLQ